MKTTLKDNYNSCSCIRPKLFKPKEKVVGYKQRSLATKLKMLSTIKSINTKHIQFHQS